MRALEDIIGGYYSTGEPTHVGHCGDCGDVHGHVWESYPYGRYVCLNCEDYRIE